MIGRSLFNKPHHDSQYQPTRSQFLKTSHHHRTNTLTRREKEILMLLSVNKTNQEIAEMLYISSGTVRVHIHAILHKFGVSDRKQAIAIALQNNLFDV